jgi:NTP pyrophosphatase (non-canonical NTP hydrolase)
MAFKYICADDFQYAIEQAREDVLVHPDAIGLFAGIKLGEEAGEVLGVIQRTYRDGKVSDFKKLEDELGDVMTWVAEIATAYDINLPKAMRRAVKKQQRRQENRKKKDAVKS